VLLLKGTSLGTLVLGIPGQRSEAGIQLKTSVPSLEVLLLEVSAFSGSEDF
jgi:hypothetical protein